MIENIKLVFQETLNGPKDLSKFKEDFVHDYPAIPDIETELKYFSMDIWDPNLKYTSDVFLNFIAFNSK